MAQLIQALNPLSFPDNRAQKRAAKERNAEFARWLAGGTPANKSETPDTEPGYTPVPFMSVEGILILAQAHEEDFGHHANTYSDMAEKFPAEEDQYVFDFLMAEHHSGEVLNSEI